MHVRILAMSYQNVMIQRLEEGIFSPNTSLSLPVEPTDRRMEGQIQSLAHDAWFPIR